MPAGNNDSGDDRSGDDSGDESGDDRLADDTGTESGVGRGADGRGASTIADSQRAVTRIIGGHEVHGVNVDNETRCGHYDTPRDVVAIRFHCCGEFYPCHACHDAVADHDATQWPRSRFDDHALLCGACGTTHTIETYLGNGTVDDDACPACGHDFNPGCHAHADRYFDV